MQDPGAGSALGADGMDGLPVTLGVERLMMTDAFDDDDEDTRDSSSVVDLIEKAETHVVVLLLFGLLLLLVITSSGGGSVTSGSSSGGGGSGSTSGEDEILNLLVLKKLGDEARPEGGDLHSGGGDDLGDLLSFNGETLVMEDKGCVDTSQSFNRGFRHCGLGKDFKSDKSLVFFVFLPVLLLPSPPLPPYPSSHLQLEVETIFTTYRATISASVSIDDVPSPLPYKCVLGETSSGVPLSCRP